MSDDKPVFPPILPRRYGNEQGRAAENRMVASVGGQGGLRTVQRLNPDGSETTGRMRAGFTEFITTEVEKEVPVVYLETGVQEGLDGTSTPATWNPLDLIPPPAYHKYIQSTPPVGAHVRGKLTASASKALDTAASKEIAATFPASLFSGLMRSFVQAQYGADRTMPLSIASGVSYSRTTTRTGTTHNQGYFPGHIQSLWDVGDAYAPTRKELVYTKGGESLTFGYGVKAGCGIVRMGGKYWLMHIDKDAGVVTVTAYPLVHRGEVKPLLGVLRAKLNIVSPTDAQKREITKLEGYLFAYSDVDLTSPTVLAEFPDVLGDPLAYGWKFNTAGTTAKLIAHTTTTSGYGRWNSYEHTITFSTNSGGTPLAAIATVNHGEWTDCKYVYLYAPCTETFDPADGANTYRLHRTSLWDSEYLGVGDNAAPAFADIPIYGFFKNDVWKPVVLTHSRDLAADTNTDVWVQYSGIFKGWFADSFGSYPFPPFVVDAHQVSSFVPSFIQFGHVFAEQAGYQPRKVPDVPLYAEWEAVWRFGRTDVSLTFDGQSYTTYYQPSGTPPTKYVYNLGASGGTFNAEITAWKNSVLAAKMAEVSGSFSGSASLDTDFDNNGIEDFYTGTCSVSRYQRDGFDCLGVVVPHGDAEAVFLPKTTGTGWTKIRSFSGTSFVGYSAHCHFSFFTTPPLTSHDSDELAPNILGGAIQFPVTSIVSVAPTPSTETKYSNRFTAPLATTYVPTYADFWPASSLYYLRGVYSFSGIGYGYDTSEGVKSHVSFDGSERFCGWV